MNKKKVKKQLKHIKLLTEELLGRKINLSQRNLSTAVLNLCILGLRLVDK